MDLLLENIFVQVPRYFLEIIDSIVGIITIGYYKTDLSTKYYCWAMDKYLSIKYLIDLYLDMFKDF